jgi:murein DD-endopeptidase MepM/ murein hydrolase activator NlpD
MILRLARPLPDGMGRVSQWFGEHPEWYAKYGLAGHSGLDYAVPVGTPVLAAHAGKIETGSDPGGYGNFVRVVGANYTTLYAHLQQINCVAGQRASVGAVLGLSGSTGNSTGPHLHFGLKVHEMRNPSYLGWIDPVPFRT